MKRHAKKYLEKNTFRERRGGANEQSEQSEMKKVTNLKRIEQIYDNTAAIYGHRASKCCHSYKSILFHFYYG